jgi:hypothetical protein
MKKPIKPKEPIRETNQVLLKKDVTDYNSVGEAYDHVKSRGLDPYTAVFDPGYDGCDIIVTGVETDKSFQERIRVYKIALKKYERDIETYRTFLEYELHHLQDDSEDG